MRGLLKEQDLNLGAQVRSLLQGRVSQVQYAAAVLHVCVQHRLVVQREADELHVLGSMRSFDHHIEPVR